MAVLYFQTGILVIIICSSFFGKKAFYSVIGLAVLWTIIMVNAPELMAAQIVTVIIGFIIGRAILKKYSKKS